MTKVKLLIGLFLTMALMFAGPGRAEEEEEIEYECCCALNCEWAYSIMNPICMGEDNASGTVIVPYAQCEGMDGEAQRFCESLDYAEAVCAMDSKSAVKALINEMFSTICPGALLGPIANYNFLRSVPQDNTCVFGVQDDCSIIDLTAPDDPRLAIFRQFRDEVLSTSPAGRRLIDLYYELSPDIIKVFHEYPSIRMHARELLGRAAPAVKAVLEGGRMAGLLSSAVVSEADMLIEEMDALIPSPLSADLSRMRQELGGE